MLACCDALRPDWNRWAAFGLERSVAFETDSLVSTRPVEFPVYAPHDCEGMFDVLTYQKGAALLRMLEQYLGEDRFRQTPWQRGRHAAGEFQRLAHARTLPLHDRVLGAAHRVMRAPAPLSWRRAVRAP